MAPAPKAPRMSQFVIATCIALRRTGLSLRKIAGHRLVKKRDGKHPTQQAVCEALATHKAFRKSAQWTLNGSGKKNRGGRRKRARSLSGSSARLVRAPQLKKTL